MIVFACCLGAEEGEGRPPISVKFEIPYFTTSGIQVRKKWTVLVRGRDSESECVCVYVSEKDEKQN